MHAQVLPARVHAAPGCGTVSTGLADLGAADTVGTLIVRAAADLYECRART